MATPTPQVASNREQSGSKVRRRGKVRLGLAIAGLLVLTGCDKSRAGALAADFSGVWDVTYDDTIEVELQLGDQLLQASVGERGGQLSFHDAGLADELELELDCTRSELLCPSEVWPRELDLQQAPGRLDQDGQQLVQPLTGRGAGLCIARPGSLITGEVMNIAKSHAVRAEAVALTSGQVRVVLDAACFAPRSGLPANARVVLSTGFTAAKR